MTDHFPTVIIGAGPAGLTAAYELVRNGMRPLVLEQGRQVGGIARTEVYKGYRFDIGGHRFYTKVKEVEDLWREMMGDDFIKVPRLSRIYYKGRFYQYPLSFLNTLTNLGLTESFLVLMSYCKARITPHRDEQTFEEWVTNRFGSRLYRTFFQAYTEKVWGIPCNKIQAEWAAQRIQNLSLVKAVANALFGSNGVKSLINEFDYPRLGPGQMWERFQQAVEDRGGAVHLNTTIVRLNCDGNRVTSVIARRDGQEFEIAAPHFISSMPINKLVLHMNPQPPEAVVKAAQSLSYRAFVLVGLIVRRENLFPDNWIYIHSPELSVGRIQNFGNWSAAMVPEPGKSCLGLEYFCNAGDDLWKTPDQELIRLAGKELMQLGLARESDVEDGVVIRQPKAYPVYDSEYRGHLEVIKSFLDQFTNLQTVGRNGMHRYNNQDHSMLTGMLAVKNILGEKHDLWDVNTERSYYEEFTTTDAPKPASAHLHSTGVIPQLHEAE